MEALVAGSQFVDGEKVGLQEITTPQRETSSCCSPGIASLVLQSLYFA